MLIKSFETCGDVCTFAKNEVDMKIWVISDTHNNHDRLITPDGIDMVIHAGDCSNHLIPELNYHEVMNFLDWYSTLNIERKILVPGNHDTSIEKGLIEFPSNVIVLRHEEIVIDGIKMFGSPYTPEFGRWAYMVPRAKLAPYWDAIPYDTEILITHGPPMGILDRNNSGLLCGCEALRNQFNWLPFVKYHLFGHIHEECGKVLKLFNRDTQFINASVCNLEYELVNNGYVIEV